jgi:hypothetical protein
MENKAMDNSANQKEQEWVQIEIPGLFEQLEESLEGNSDNETETESTQRIEFAATQTKSACAD